MKLAALDVFVCPACHGDLRLYNASQHGLEILEGRLTCSGCAAVYPIERGVPRFVPAGSYAQSFGRQWHWFRGVQMDSANRSSESEAALRATTGWRDDEYPGIRRMRRIYADQKLLNTLQATSSFFRSVQIRPIRPIRVQKSH
jgi:uncharacterized protein YbaR (Trm112 family)